MHAYASTIVWVKYLKASVQALAHYATIILTEHNRYGEGWFTIIKFMNSSSYSSNIKITIQTLPIFYVSSK